MDMETTVSLSERAKRRTRSTVVGIQVNVNTVARFPLSSPWWIPSGRSVQSISLCGYKQLPPSTFSAIAVYRI